MYCLFPEFSSLPGVTKDSDKGALFGESHPNNKIHPHLDGLLCPSRHIHERQCGTGGGFPAWSPSAHSPLETGKLVPSLLCSWARTGDTVLACEVGRVPWEDCAFKYVETKSKIPQNYIQRTVHVQYVQLDEFGCVQTREFITTIMALDMSVTSKTSLKLPSFLFPSSCLPSLPSFFLYGKNT